MSASTGSPPPDTPRSMADLKYRAFISYSHKDRRWADWLHKGLETYKPPSKLVGVDTPRGVVPGRLGRVFRDREELPSSADLGRKITQALTESATQVVICSPNSARSHWVNEEILAFKRLGGEERIFCVIVDGEPGASDIPGREAEECFPPALRFRLGPDGKLSNQRTEPIAADARDVGDGKANAKLKLIAGMLGVGFDDLKQRDLQRRQRRLVAIAAASIVGMLIASALATAALIARAEADRQRIRAENEAETAKQTTDFLVGLFEVSDPSEARGNTVTAREILDQGAGRIQSELNNQPEVQATLMHTMGNVYRSLGLYEQADSLLHEALAKREALFGPRDLNVAETQAHLAQVLSLRADFDPAGPLYERALQTQRELLGSNAPEVAETLLGQADLLTMQGEYEAAELLLRESLEIRRALYGERHLDVAESLEYVGLNLLDQGDYAGAKELLRDALQVRQALLGDAPHPDLKQGLNNLAYAYYFDGQYSEAEQLFSEALDMARRLYGEVHPEIAHTLNNLANVQQDRGDYVAAEARYRDVLEMRHTLYGESHPEIASVMNNLAFLMYEMGDTDAAMSVAQQSLNMNRELYPGDHPEVAIGLANIGAWLVVQQDYAAAEPMLTEALEMFQRLLEDEHLDVAATRSTLAMLYLETGRTEAALEAAIAARRVLAEALPPDHWRVAWATSLEGAALAELGDFEVAEDLLLASYEILAANSGARPLHVDSTLQYLVDLYVAWDKPAEASQYQASLDAAAAH